MASALLRSEPSPLLRSEPAARLRQRAIDAAIDAGGGTVSWPRRGPYRITAPLVVCPENPTRSWEDSWPPSTVHFASYTSITLSSPAHAILRADPSGNWPSFASNLTPGMLLLGVASQSDGSGAADDGQLSP